jgi:hypothetical protein
MSDISSPFGSFNVSNAQDPDVRPPGLRRSSLCQLLLWGALVLTALVLAGGSGGAPARVLATAEVYVVSAAGGVPRALAAAVDRAVSPTGA